MICEYCRGLNNLHDYRCPNYCRPKFKTDYHCCYCDNGIHIGEEYITNCDGEYLHVYCIPSNRWLLDWLSVEIKEM